MRDRAVKIIIVSRALSTCFFNISGVKFKYVVQTLLKLVQNFLSNIFIVKSRFFYSVLILNTPNCNKSSKQISVDAFLEQNIRKANLTQELIMSIGDSKTRYKVVQSWIQTRLEFVLRLTISFDLCSVLNWLYRTSFRLQSVLIKWTRQLQFEMSLLKLFSFFTWNRWHVSLQLYC